MVVATSSKKKRSLKTPKLHPPRQARSRVTMDRILDATERLLDERTFDEISVNEVIRKARTSSGAFYARFEGKEALLDALHTRYQSMVQQATDDRMSPEFWQDATLEEIIRGVIRSILMLYRRRRGFFRSVVLREYVHPTLAAAHSLPAGKMPPVRLGALLETRRDEINHPNPRLAGAMGFLMMMGVLREKVLFADAIARSVRISDQRLEDELTAAFLAYLGVKPRGKTGASRKRRKPNRIEP